MSHTPICLDFCPKAKKDYSTRVKCLKAPNGPPGDPGPQGEEGKRGEAGSGNTFTALRITALEQETIDLDVEANLIEVDTSNNIALLRMGAPSTPHYLRIKLLYQRGLSAYIRSISGGEFELNAALPEIVFVWAQGKWNVIDDGRGMTSFTPYQGYDNASTVTPTQYSTRVAISADGKTLAVACPDNEIETGSVTVFVRQDNNWLFQAKIAGVMDLGQDRQGSDVALSADGSTLALGAAQNDNNYGAVWIFTRNGDTWTQQAKLFPSVIPAFGSARVGFSVALSADGNTLVAGAPSDDTYDGNAYGAAWIWYRESGTWSEIVKLTETTSYREGELALGSSVSISAAGELVALGDPGYNAGAGRALLYQKQTAGWNLVAQLEASDLARTASGQGSSVSLSASGTTLAVGAPKTEGPQGREGGVWVFGYEDEKWSQQGPCLFGYDYYNASQQGTSVSLTADGNNLAVGGPGDNLGTGAVWLWRRTNNNWYQYKKSLTSGNGSSEGSSVSISADGSALAVLNRATQDTIVSIYGGYNNVL